MDVKLSRKRPRDINDCTDCMPLSKRINSLSIDNSNLPLTPDAFFHVNVNVEPRACTLHSNMISSNWPSPVSESLLHFPTEDIVPSGYLPNFNPNNSWSESRIPNNHQNYQQQSNFNSSYENNHQGVQASNHVESGASELMYNNAHQNHASWVSSLKYNHDNVESEYYVHNRLLFDLYVERISRTGEQPANPY